METISDIYELSPMQQGMLFHSLYNSSSGMYCEQRSCLLTGKLSISAFKQAWQAVINRHTILRTAFYWEEVEKPLQVVYQEVELPWIEYDWRGLTEQEQEEKLGSFLLVEQQQGFDLNYAPLMRCGLMQVREDAYYFVWNYHHLLLDGWCNGILLKEVFAFYEAFRKEQNLFLQPTRPYKDYITWLQQQNQEQATAFWKNSLQGLISPTVLSIGNNSVSEERKEKHYQLSNSLTTSLQTIIQKHRLTLNTLFQGAWALLLSHYSGESDIIFGATVSGRPPSLTDVESMVGLFINTLPVRIEIKSTTFLLPWLQSLQTQQIEKEQYSYSSLIEIQGWSEVPRGTALFESLVIFENYPISLDKALQGWSNQLTISEGQGVEKTNYPVTVSVLPGSPLAFRISYDKQRFSDSSIDRLIKHLENLLTSIARNPEQQLWEIALLTNQEQKELLIEGDGKEEKENSNILIHQLFEAQVEKIPNNTAVIFEEELLTYQELNKKANQLAHHLRNLGVKPETLVGICLEPSLEMVIALLAILKVGGAYLPLDPNYPQQRLEFMIQDSEIDYLISSSALKNNNSNTVKHFIDISTIQAEINQQKNTNLALKINPENLAYIIYTSGSTGIPKGVQVPHSCLSNFLLSMKEKPGLTDKDTLLSVTTLSFDIAALELYLPLTVGAKLILVSRDVTVEGVTLAQQLLTQKVTVMQATPATWKLLLASGWEGKKDLTILCGGEALSPDLAEQLKEKSKQVFNLYGPTETTIWSSVYEVETEKVRLGKPINNTQLYILDKDYNQLPIGVPGELYIGGKGVTRGYLKRPELTAERFIANPFKAGERLYKTGDLVKYGEDREIEYIGRIDYQVKLRGYRLELGEIETTILNHNQIKEAVVIVKEESLIAYIVCQEDISINPRSIKEYIGEKLPNYMIPSRFVELEKLPLTPNGKIDRKALPEIELKSEDYIVPKTATEEILAGIWGTILNIERVSVEENFFEIGGHSLLATQIMSQVRQVFEVELPLRVLFEKPTIRSLSKVIEGEEKQEIVSLKKIERSGELPLSFAQQRQWFLAQLEPDSPFYNIAIALRFKGSLNIVALTHSFQEVMKRHEVLRTGFITQDGKPNIAITDTTNLSIPVIDLSLIPLEKQEETITKLSQEEAQKPFNIESCPLLRVKLLRLTEEEHILLLTMHHIISDAWSMGILVQEVATFYQAFLQEQPSSLPELPIQYLDFSAWQRQWLQGERLDTQLNYWKTQLQDAPTLLEMPSDRPRPVVQNFHGSTYSCTISQPLTEQLQSLCHQTGTTLFMLLLATFSVLLHRYSSNEDIVIGSPIANRNYGEIEGLIGFFVNTLALRIDLSENPTFLDLLKQVRQVALGAYSHQDVPFERLLEALEIPRSLSHTPLFQVMFVLQNTPLNPIQLPELQWEPLEMDNHTAKFDLTLMMRETEDGLLTTWEYNTELFKQETIIRLGNCFETLLNAIITDAEQPISELSLLDEQEQELIINMGNVLQPDSVGQFSIHQLFAEQVHKTPDAIAVICGDQQLTYQELDRKTNQLANYLQRFGVQPDTLIGLCVERSLGMIIGILAILKSGGAYVPIDTNSPPERINLLLEDTKINLLLTQTNIDYPWPHPVTVIHIDETAITEETESTPSVHSTPEHLAYVMYTSGSTGIPKGVCIPHRGVVRLVKNSNYVALREDDVFLQAAPYTFDASTFEIWGALLNGGSLVILPSQTPSLEEIAETIATYEVTTLWLTAGLFHLMVEERLESFGNVRYLLAGGDILSLTHVKTVLQTYPNCRVINGYGPTENTTFTCCSVLTDVEQVNNSVPIGRPISQTQVYILDNYLQPVPYGVPGELYIAGEGLGRGYLNRPQLTAATFIASPFATGERLYKTGDLVRYDREGQIEFLGRKDNQVKIRGFRVELGEIEATIQQYPKVQTAIAMVKETSEGNKQLIAYVVAKTDENLSSEELKTFLSQKLPDYLHPNHYMILDGFPLTANGKVDRRSLPQPILSTSNTEAPRNAIETQLAKIWQDVLNLEKVGIEDNFFELGGDSILAIQIVSRASRIGLRLSPKHLFQHQTISQLAAIATSMDSSVGEQGLITGTVPLTPIQHWFFEQNLTKMTHFNQSAFLEVPKNLDFIQLETVFSHLLTHHDALRMRFNPRETDWEAMISDKDDPVPLNYFDLSGLGDQQQETAIAVTASQLQASLNISAGPLLRIALFELGNTRNNQLLIIIHHLVVDGVSWRILLDNFQTAYQQLTENQTIQLPFKTTSIKTWSETLQTYDVEAEKEYWRQITSKTVVSLPVDYIDGENTIATTEQVTVMLGKEDTENLLKTLPKAYNTQINEVLLTALVKTVSQWTGQDSVLINLESHGREDIWENMNVSRTLGWFTSIYPVFLTLEGSESLLTALEAIKGQLNSIPHQGMGYGVMRYLHQESDIRSLAEISFNYLGQFDALLSNNSQFNLSPYTAGLHHDINQYRPHLLEINGSVMGGELQFTWSYSNQIHKISTIEAIAQEFINTLRQLINDCQSNDETVSDLSLVDLDEDTLEQVLGMVDFG
ncbi:amino acid adenylation domain-containing protein [Crocosphaera sp. Alani8]|uniref:amino acid adenylation domain-containing protein n=1 Tax=Crocosphaera sp. Alani8 TaxID=3038952 RepID=UPI00313C7F93